MAQNKAVNWILLMLVFAASTAAGYFIAQLVIDGPRDTFSNEEIVEESDVETFVEEAEDTVLMEEAVADTVAEEIVEEEPQLVIYEPFTSEQMEDLINSGDFDQRPTNSKSIFKAENRNIIVRNLREGDEHPDDIAQLCSKVADGFWDGVTNTVIIANDQNIIIRIETTAVYPEE